MKIMCSLGKSSRALLCQVTRCCSKKLLPLVCSLSVLASPSVSLSLALSRSLSRSLSHFFPSPSTRAKSHDCLDSASKLQSGKEKNCDVYLI